MRVPPRPGPGMRQHHTAAGCVRDDDLAALLTGDASVSVVERALEHAAECDPCRELLARAGRVRAHAKRHRAAMAHADPGPRRPSAAPDQTDLHADARSTFVGAPQPDASIGADAGGDGRRAIGRYVVLEVLGRGGMGQVWRAYDPKLRREVALKVVRTRGGTGGAVAAEARLLREAYALARLSHPNVVAVYDAETTDRGVAIAMEYVDGRTLRAWLDEQPRAWTEVVDVGVRIAAGLAAAHAAGLVHRDVKPDNVLVGNDGRVRVSDFGLARGYDAEAAQDQEIDVDVGHADATLTETGQIVGTPAFMAPEQHEGIAPDARADQYALCLVLYEALHGVRPFCGADLAALAMRKRAGPPQRPPRSIPSWLHRTVLRGLAPDPARRWPSVDALRKALLSGRRRGRQRRLLIATGAALTIVGTWFGLGELDRRTARSACRKEGERFVEGLTGELARAELHGAITAVEVSHATDTANRVVPMLDAYGQDLQRARSDACLAANVERRVGWDTDRLDRATWCLEERHADVSALRSELMLGDGAAVTHAVPAVSALSPVQPCADAAWLARLPVPPERERQEARAVRDELARARARARVGAYAEGLTSARAAHERASALGWPPLSAEARRWVGNLLEETGAFEASAVELEAAYFEAARAGAFDVAADAAIRLVYNMGQRLYRHEDAMRWAQHAEVALASLPDSTGLREAERLVNLALTQVVIGEFAKAEATNDRALAIVESALGADHFIAAATLHNLAMAKAKLGKRREAKATLERALRIDEQALGPEHPNVATTLNTLGVVLGDLGEHAEATVALDRALRIRRAALGEEHPDVAQTLMNLGTLHVGNGDYERARNELEESVRIREKVLPPDHPEIAGCVHNLAIVYTHLEDYERARQHYERALGIETRALGPEHLEVAQTRAGLGHLALATGAHGEARLQLERALAIIEAELGPEHPQTALVLAHLAEVALAEDRPHDAVQLAARAVESDERGETSPEQLAHARFVLARAVVADGGAPSRALSLAERSRDGYRGLGAPGRQWAAEVEAWLAERGLTPAE